LAAKSFHDFPKQLLKQYSRPMLIRIGEVGFAGSLRNSKVLQLTQTTTQAVADEPQRVGVGQMAKQHRHELRPTRKASRMSFGAGLLHQGAKFCAGEMMKKLIKQTGGLYHILALLLRSVSHPPCHGTDAIQQIIGGHFSFSGPS